MIVFPQIYYLANPYSHKDKSIQHKRAEAVHVAAIKFKRMGIEVFSPIINNHFFSLVPGMHVTFEAWKYYDFKMIKILDGVLVLMLDGWKESIGVTAEIKFALENGIRVRYVDPVTNNILEESNVP